MKWDILQLSSTNVDANINDLGSEHNDDNVPKGNFVHENNHKYCTIHKERDIQLLYTMKIHHQMITLMIKLTLLTLQKNLMMTNMILTQKVTITKE